MPRRIISLSLLIASLSLITAPMSAQVEDVPIAEVEQDSRTIEWIPSPGRWRITLRISDQVGLVAQQAYGPDERIVLDVAGLPDGRYGWELLAQPVIAADAGEAMHSAAHRRERRRLHDEAKRLGRIPRHPASLSGTFTVIDGKAAPSDLPEEGAAFGFRQAIADDLSVQGSLCTGLDCPDALNFGFTTLLLTENNTRLKFDDTSNSASFANNDWELVANDHTNGGGNFFAIRDCGVSSGGGCSGPDPFKVEAGAPNNALYVHSSGNVGIGSASPVLELHIVDGDSPSIRLDQQGGGFASQVWDIAGNETNFFVRDVTNASKLPFKIQPGAPDDTLYLSSAGYVGLGISNPESKMHLQASDDDTVDRNKVRYYAENTSAVEGNRAMAYLKNKGGVAIYYEDTSSSLRWQTLAADNEFFISRLGSGASELKLDDSGNLRILGTLAQGSDRNAKRDIEPVDVESVLKRVAALTISAWSYKTDAPGIRHMGPMAQDFRAAFGLGSDERSIAAIDASGVALASIQALQRQIEELKAELAEVRSKLAAVQDED